MKLSIIIVSYNTKYYLEHCLGSILEQTKSVEYEIIVVDNKSTDGSPDFVRTFSQQYPQVPITLIENDDNYGFGAANNQGADKSQGDWLLFLNSDTKLIDRTLEQVFTWIDSQTNENLVIGCQLLNGDQSLQPSAGYFPTSTRIWMQMAFIDDLPMMKQIFLPYQQSDVTFYTRQQFVDWVTGAFLMMPRKHFFKVHGFDPQIFMYGEEVDLQYRLKQEGATILYTPIAKVFHFKGKSSPDGFKAAVLGEYKGLITFYLKHFPQHLLMLKGALLTGALLRLVIFGIMKREKASIYWEALLLIMSFHPSQLQ